MFRVVILPGGGIRGLLQALVLQAIAERAGAPLHELVDLFVGTSTGGILAACAALGLSPEEMAGFYREHGPNIFRNSLGKRLSSCWGLFDETYDARGLESALAAVFGDAALSQVRTRLCLTAYDIETRKPVLFKSWKAQASARDDHLLTAITRATSAAPTYFEPAMVKSSTGLMRACVDGGIWANNPGAVGLVEALKLAGSPRKIKMLCVGTGCDERPYRLSEARGWGKAAWVRPLLDMLFSGQSDGVDYECAAILGSNYLRLQPMLGDPIAMDDASEKAFSNMAFYAAQVIDSSDMDRALKLLGAA